MTPKFLFHQLLLAVTQEKVESRKDDSLWKRIKWNVIGADESTNVFQSTKEYVRPMLYKVNHGQKYEDFTKIL